MSVYGLPTYGDMVYGYDGIDTTWPTLRYYIGDYVPAHSINLAYVHVPEIRAADNVRLIHYIDTSLIHSVKEKFVMYSDGVGHIQQFESDNDYIIFTDKYDVPEQTVRMHSDNEYYLLRHALWYRHKLRSYVAGPVGLATGEWFDGNIKLVLPGTDSIPDGYCWRINIDAVITDGVYECSVWTNFQRPGYYIEYTDSNSVYRREMLLAFPTVYQATTTGVFRTYSAIINANNKYDVTCNDVFEPNYPVCIYIPTSHIFRLFMPAYNPDRHAWYLKIGRGNVIRNGLLYRNSMYYQQNFVSNKLPVMRILTDKCQLINHRQLKVTHTPVYMCPDTADSFGIKVYVSNDRSGSTYTTYSTKPIGTEDAAEIVDIDCINGIITLPDNSIREDSIVSADYYIWELYHSYTGYNNNIDIYRYIDFNPNYNHYTVYTADSQTYGSSKYLIDKDIHIWLNNNNISDQNIYHTFTSSHNEQHVTSNSDTMLIGVVNVSGATKQPVVFDARRRGGGIKRSIKPNHVSEQYWDISYWEGIPYQSNGAYVVDINTTKQYTKKYIKSITDEYGAAGTMALLTNRTGSDV